MSSNNQPSDEPPHNNHPNGQAHGYSEIRPKDIDGIIDRYIDRDKCWPTEMGEAATEPVTRQK